MEYKSLYTYLGHGAGSKLGKEVATKASELGLKLEKLYPHPGLFIHTQ